MIIRSLIASSLLFASLLPAHADDSTLSPDLDTAVRTQILAEGVPAASLDRILSYLKKNLGQEVTVDAYDCKPDPKHPNRSAEKPCGEELRERSTKRIKISMPRYVVSIDFSKPSTAKRFYFIDLQTGKVESFAVTHGKGSGDGKWSYKFSNRKDSNMTSLGLYAVGPSYEGKYGRTGRMYGLERSNDQAYERDIVFHGAGYAREEFISRINSRTKAPFGRLGLSWGCPAIAPESQKRLLPLLLDVGIIDHFHPELIDSAQSGQQVSVTPPVEAAPTPMPTPIPTPTPATVPEIVKPLSSKVPMPPLPPARPKFEKVSARSGPHAHKTRER